MQHMALIDRDTDLFIIYYFVQKITEEKYDVSISSSGNEIVVCQQSEPCVTCIISLTSPVVKDDMQAAGKYCSCCDKKAVLSQGSCVMLL